MYIYIYIYIHTHTYIYISVCVCVCVCVCVFVCVRVCIYTYVSQFIPLPCQRRGLTSAILLNRGRELLRCFLKAKVLMRRSGSKLLEIKVVSFTSQFLLFYLQFTCRLLRKMLFHMLLLTNVLNLFYFIKSFFRQCFILLVAYLMGKTYKA